MQSLIKYQEVYRENPKSALQAEYISWDLNFKIITRHTIYLLRKLTYGDRLLWEDKCKKQEEEVKGNDHYILQKHTGKQKMLKADCKTSALIQGQQLKQPKHAKDLAQSEGQWGTPGKSCVLVELLRADWYSRSKSWSEDQTLLGLFWKHGARLEHVDQQRACPAFIPLIHWGYMLILSLSLHARNLGFLLLCKPQGNPISVPVTSESNKGWPLIVNG